MKSRPDLKRADGHASMRQPPWWVDAQVARRTALNDARPCVLILNADSSAL